MSLDEKAFITPWNKIHQLVMKHMDHLITQNPNTLFLSCWDFDGTLLKGDIGEGLHTEKLHEYYGLVEEAIIRGFIPAYSGQSSLKLFWHEYKNIAQKNSLLKAYQFLVECLYTIPQNNRDEFKELCKKLVDKHISNYFYAETRSLMIALKKKKIFPVIISASPQILIDSVIHHFPVDPQFAFGVGDPAEDKQVFNYAEGKVARIELASKYLRDKFNTEVTAIFAIGDSWDNDGAMMREISRKGGLALCINPRSTPNWVGNFNIHCTQLK